MIFSEKQEKIESYTFYYMLWQLDDPDFILSTIK